MDEKSLRILEYHKIKQMLSEMCVSETGREKVKAMLPFSELSQVKTAPQTPLQKWPVVTAVSFCSCATIRRHTFMLSSF